MVRKLIKAVLLIALMAVLFVVPTAIYYFYSYYTSLETELVTRFSGKRWDIPSRIYYDSLIVYPGQNLKDLGFLDRLARLNYHRIGPNEKVSARGEYSFDAKRSRLVLFLHSFGYPYRRFDGELVEMRISPDQRILLMADPVTQKPIFSIELEPELISGIFQGVWEQRRLIRLSQIPPAMIDAILAAEDHRFYEHHGIDPMRIAKAAWVDLISGRLRQGGSTLTQQLMKNFFLTQKRDWHRKVKEILMAYIAERRFSKEEILENYVNDIYLGQHGQEGIFGIWEASQFYFSKEP